MNFLIVDDSKAMRNILTKAMKNIGYTNDNYDYAADGFEALSKIKQNPPDLVLSDLHMPNMSGIELINALKNENLSVKIGIVTIDNQKEIVDQVTEAGAAFYLLKPFTAAQLTQTIFENASAEQLSERRLKPKLNPVTLPSLHTLETVFSSLGRCDVSIEKQGLEQFDFSTYPVIVGSLSDQNDRVKLYVIFDCLAINTITSLLNRSSSQEAQDLTANNTIGAHSLNDVETFMGLLSILVRGSNKEDTYKVHATHLWNNPGSDKIKKFMLQHKDAITMISISAPDLVGGKIIFDPM